MPELLSWNGVNAVDQPVLTLHPNLPGRIPGRRVNTLS